MQPTPTPEPTFSALKQSETSFAKYLVWFGTCLNEHHYFDLTSTSLIKRCVEYTQSGVGLSTYDASLPSMLQDFTELKVGHIYLITLTKGDSEFLLQGAVHSYKELTTNGKVTLECGGVVNPTPTPTPTPEASSGSCCAGLETVTVGDDKLGVSLVSEPVGNEGGTLCFESIDDDPGSNQSFPCVFENGEFACTVGLDLLLGPAAVKDKKFRYTTTAGKCYEADFTGFSADVYPGPVMKIK